MKNKNSAAVVLICLCICLYLFPFPHEWACCIRFFYFVLWNNAIHFLYTVFILFILIEHYAWFKHTFLCRWQTVSLSLSLFHFSLCMVFYLGVFFKQLVFMLLGTLHTVTTNMFVSQVKIDLYVRTLHAMVSHYFILFYYYTAHTVCKYTCMWCGIPKMEKFFSVMIISPWKKNSIPSGAIIPIKPGSSLPVRFYYANSNYPRTTYGVPCSHGKRNEMEWNRFERKIPKQKHCNES